MVASLDHPHLLPVYEAGEHDGLPFFSMKFAEGGSLARHVGEFAGDFRRIARLVADCARAVHHAHQRGILHRDLKPGNILLDADGSPFVTDFGIAKWLGRDSSLTLTNAALGTPGYAAPEQVDGRGRDVTTAADIHGLGAVLYELLTQRPPFTGGTALDVIRKVADEAPVAPRAVRPAVPRDLETICLRCLAKEPTDRFASAAALAADLDRWLDGRTILARPSTTGERLGRWMRRNPALAGVSALAAALIVAVAVGSTVAALRLQAQNERVVAAERQTQEQLRAALIAQARAGRLTGRAGQRFDVLDAIQRAAAIRPGADLRDEAVAALSLPDIKVERLWAAKRTLYGPLVFDPTLRFYANEPEDDVLTVRRSADQAEVSRFRPEKPSSKPIKWIGPWSESGKHLTVVHGDGTVRFFRVGGDGALTLEREYPAWDAATFPGCSSYVAWSPDERLFAMGSLKDGASVRDAESGVEVRRLKPGEPVACVAWSPDGASLAVAARWSGEVHVYSLRDGAERQTFRAAMGVETMDWSPDGRWFGVASNRASVLVFDAASGELRHTLRVLGGGAATTLAFSHDGAVLASSGRDSATRFWEPVTGQPLVFIQPESAEPALRFSPDDARVAVSPFSREAGLARFAHRDVLRKTPHRVDGDPLTEFGSCDLSADGRLLAVGSFSGVRICDARHGREIASYPLDQDARKTAQFDADGRWLYVGSARSGLTRRPLVWRSRTELEIGPAETLDAAPGWLLTSPRGPGTMRAFVRDGDTSFALRDLARPAEWTRTWEHRYVWQAILSPDGKYVATAPDNQAPAAEKESASCRLWDARTGALLRAFHGGQGGTVMFSPSGRYLYSSGAGPSKIFQVEPWREIFTLPMECDEVVFSPAESMIACVGSANHVHLLSFPAGEPLATLTRRPTGCSSDRTGPSSSP